MYYGKCRYRPNLRCNDSKDVVLAMDVHLQGILHHQDNKANFLIAVNLAILGGIAAGLLNTEARHFLKYSDLMCGVFMTAAASALSLGTLLFLLFPHDPSDAMSKKLRRNSHFKRIYDFASNKRVGGLNYEKILKSGSVIAQRKERCLCLDSTLLFLAYSILLISILCHIFDIDNYIKQNTEIKKITEVTEIIEIYQNSAPIEIKVTNIR
ncbi:MULTISPECIES: hypothetical protein [unclassified Iodidimonas]|jgi:hypothetical protein|uniref:hypothetical protein n=1 Tax=unclassified Iodidimonas TaxID=2626145 RepID=UPI0024824246|nr:MULTISPECIES: hypothetical protein [unclassified Iodidimonas]